MLYIVEGHKDGKFVGDLCDYQSLKHAKAASSRRLDKTDEIFIWSTKNEGNYTVRHLPITCKTAGEWMNFDPKTTE